MMTKHNTSTMATWNYFLKRAVWRLVYDPEFMSSKKRSAQALKIIEDKDGVTCYLMGNDGNEKWHTKCVDTNDAWICIVSDLYDWATTFEQDDAANGFFRESSLQEAMRANTSSSENIVVQDIT